MTKPGLLLLHGALGSAKIFEQLIPLLSDHFDILCPDFCCHGTRAETGDGFKMSDLVEDLEEIIVKDGRSPYHVFGFSMGGYVAMSLALKSPQYFSGIMSLGTKLAWSPEQALHESKMLNPEKIAEKVPSFAQYLASQHGDGWQQLCRQTANMMVDLGNSPILSKQLAKNLSMPISIGLGDADNMVSKEESEAFASALPNGRFDLLANTPHPFEKVDNVLIANTILNFLKN